MPTTVPRIALSPTLSIPRVVTGMWQIADMERDAGLVDPEATAGAMADYHEAGLTAFDMADHYGSAEEIAGRFAASGRRSELLTKWVPKPGPITRAEVHAAVRRSLDRLRVDALDLLQFHAWSYSDPRWLDCLFWLSELRDLGLVRNLGLTNFDSAHLGMVLASGIPVVSNQVCWSLIDRRAGGRMSDLCERTGVRLLTYGTLAGGLLTERWLGAPEPALEQLATWSQMKYARFIHAAGGWSLFQNLLQALADVAGRRGVSIANVATRFVLDQPAVGAVIVGARLGERDHVADTLRLFAFELSPADRTRLEEAALGLDPLPGDCGDEYRRPPFLTASGDLSHHFDEFPAPYPIHVSAHGRVVATSGTRWEAIAGYGRAVRLGSRVLVSGTTATHGDRLIGGADPVAQTHFAIDKIEAALRSLGATLADVVRTRIYVTDRAHAEAISRAHGERFRDILPANTLIRADLVGDGYLVEIEAEAEIRPA